MQVVIHLALALLPVLCFLLVLISLDSFKLVHLRTVLLLLLAGMITALASLVLNRWLTQTLELEPVHLTRYAAPIVEELAKGLVVVYLLVRRRIGFLVDAAICGFAVGAGFAAVENLHYFSVLGDSRVVVWLVRGFGTAVMHGAVTASMAIMSKTLIDRHGGLAFWTLLPGWLLAIGVHSAFNHFFLAPDLSTLVLLATLPLFFLAVFRISEQRTREWLGTGFDSDGELLRLINEGRTSESPIGGYLHSLKTKLPAATVGDMLCLLKLRLELSIRAKGILILRQAGASPEPDPAMAARFSELRYLERSIGKTGLAAMAPIMTFSDRDLWQYNMLGELQASGRGAAKRRVRPRPGPP